MRCGLLDLERCTQRVDAKDRRRCAAQVDAARRRSVCRRVSERKDLSAAHESNMQQARVHLGRRVRARNDSGAAALPARRGYIRGRGRFCRGGGGGERRRRWPGVVAAAATVPGPLPAGEVVDVCVRRYDVVGRRRQRAQLPNSQLPPHTAGGGPARHAIHRRRCRCRHARRHRAHPTAAAASPGVVTRWQVQGTTNTSRITAAAEAMGTGSGGGAGMAGGTAVVTDGVARQNTR